MVQYMMPSELRTKQCLLNFPKKKHRMFADFRPIESSMPPFAVWKERFRSTARLVPPIVSASPFLARAGMVGCWAKDALPIQSRILLVASISKGPITRASDLLLLQAYGPGLPSENPTTARITAQPRGKKGPSGCGGERLRASVQ